MANGFVSTAPGARHGDSVSAFNSSDYAFAQKFTAPGSGILEISRIGAWIAKVTNNSSARLAIFGDDSANGCPSTMVANSETGTITISSATISDIGADYSTKPQVAAGVPYWLACNLDSSVTGGVEVDRFATTGKVAGYLTTTFPAWPDDATWHGQTDIDTRDYSLYAVYNQYSLFLNGIMKSMCIPEFLGGN